MTPFNLFYPTLTSASTPTRCNYPQFKTDRRVPKLGVMLVGWGGNNGTTVTAGIIANRNKLTWRTKEGVKSANYFGSLTQSSTVRIGQNGKDEAYVPFASLLPMVHPNDIVLGGWDISSANLAEGMERAAVLDIAIQDQVRDELAQHKPLPGVFDQDFIAANQGERADNVIKGTKKEQMEQVSRLIAVARGVEVTRDAGV